jgi:hypothetical protein
MTNDYRPVQAGIVIALVLTAALIAAWFWFGPVALMRLMLG